MKKLAALLVGALCLVGVVGCDAQPAETAEPPPPVMEPLMFLEAAVHTAPVTRGSLGQVTALPGLVRVGWEALSFEVPGSIARVYVLPGDRVHEGQLLARLDGESFEEAAAEYRESLALLLRRQALAEERFLLEMQLMQANYNRAVRRAAETLDTQDSDYALEINMDMQSADNEHTHYIQLLNFEIQDARRRMQDATDSLAQVYIHAPADGYITFNDIFLTGAFVDAETPIVFFSEKTEVFVEYVGSMSIPPAWLNSQRIVAQINGLEYGLDFDPGTDVMEITRRRLMGDPPDIRFEIMPRTDGQMPALGDYATILIYITWNPDVLRMPLNALMHNPQDGHFTYRMIDGVPTMTHIRVRTRTTTHIEILEGLEEGDEVVVR